MTANDLRRLRHGLDRTVEPGAIAGALRAYGLTQADIAVAAGVTDRAVRNWKPDTSVRRSTEQRLQRLRGIVLVLADSLTPKGVGQWFRAPNRLLGGDRPLDRLGAGEFDAVGAAAEAFADGAYV